MVIEIRCIPPSTTAQHKRQHYVGGKPVFFKAARMAREEQTWAALLTPYRLPAPMVGPTRCAIRLVYPHLKATKLTEQLIPKVSKPDLDNATKALVDLLAELRFIEDDKQIAHFEISKFHGPERAVGIRIELLPLDCSWKSGRNPREK
jgi:Holliday junction resolvase RusA-like endonuclease